VVRGVADANFLSANGVICSLSSNNVLNAATPYGDCSLIRIANLHANILQIAAPGELRELFLMLTERSAQLLKLKDYGLAPAIRRHRGDRRDDPGTGGRPKFRPPLAGCGSAGGRTVVRQAPELLRRSDRAYSTVTFRVQPWVTAPPETSGGNSGGSPV